MIRARVVVCALASTIGRVPDKASIALLHEASADTIFKVEVVTNSTSAVAGIWQAIANSSVPVLAGFALIRWSTNACTVIVIEVLSGTTFTCYLNALACAKLIIQDKAFVAFLRRADAFAVLAVPVIISTTIHVSWHGADAFAVVLVPVVAVGTELWFAVAAAVGRNIRVNSEVLRIWADFDVADAFTISCIPVSTGGAIFWFENA